MLRNSNKLILVFNAKADHAMFLENLPVPATGGWEVLGIFELKEGGNSDDAKRSIIRSGILTEARKRAKEREEEEKRIRKLEREIERERECELELELQLENKRQAAEAAKQEKSNSKKDVVISIPKKDKARPEPSEAPKRLTIRLAARPIVAKDVVVREPEPNGSTTISSVHVTDEESDLTDIEDSSSSTSASEPTTVPSNKEGTITKAITNKNTSNQARKHKSKVFVLLPPRRHTYSANNAVDFRGKVSGGKKMG